MAKRSEAPSAISEISVTGFKSIASKQTIAVRPLTILAGANSSGKSSIMQPLLLLKQTLEAPYDPGALLIRGPLVEFTSVEQFFSCGGGEAKHLEVGIQTTARRGIELTFVRDKAPALTPLRVSRQSLFDADGRFELEPSSSSQQIKEALASSGINELVSISEYCNNFSVLRNQSFLDIKYDVYDNRMSVEAHFSIIKIFHLVRRLLSDLIHLPGLRGNPKRTYPISAVGDSFPGYFQDYVASLMAHWSHSEKDKLRQLGEDLRSLGLTWKVEAQAIDDTQVEVRVGRLANPKKGAPHDLVNIADVGFGVSQTLPVVVALLAAKPGQLVYIEQPELHLHPRAQVAMASLLANAAKRGVRVVAETHSSLILLAIQSLIASEELSPEDVILHWFQRDETTGASTIRTAELDDAGRFGDWPVDFDEVALEAENHYLSAAEARLMGE